METQTLWGESIAYFAVMLDVYQISEIKGK